MSSAKQAMTQPIDPGYTDAAAGLKGHRDNGALAAAFPEAPIFPNTATPAYTDEGATNVGITTLNGTDKSLPTFITDIGTVAGIVNDSGYMFSAFNLNYQGSEADPVPNLADVETGGGGLPASAYVPNLASVGELQLANPGAQPEFPAENLPNPGLEVGSGLAAHSTEMSPHNSSTKIANNTIGGYLKGRSWAADE